MVSNEIYTGSGASVTLIPEMDLKLSEHFGDNTHKLCATSNNERTVELANNSPNLETNIYRGCMAKLEKYNSSNVYQTDEDQILLIESNDSNSITFSQALSTVSTDKYKITVLAFGAPIHAQAIDGKQCLLSDNWLGLVESFTAPTVTPQLKQLNLALGGTRNFGFQFHGTEDIGEASIDVSLNNGSWLYYALGKMSYTAGSLGTDNLSSIDSGHNGNSFAIASSGSKIYRVEDTKIYPPFISSVTDSNQVVSVTVTDDGAGIPFSASQTLSFSGGSGSGAAASYTLTKDKHEITTVTVVGANYDDKWIKIEAAASTTIKYVFWFDIDNAGESVPSHGVSGATVVEVSTINTGDGAETVATKLAAVINAQTGLTATASGDEIIVESTNGGAVGAVTQASSPPLTVTQLVEGGEIDAVTVTAGGSGYTGTPTIANITTGSTNATFTAVKGAGGLADYKQVTGPVAYTFTENNSGDLPSFALEVTNEKGNITDAEYFQDSDKQKVMSKVYTGCQVNTLTLNFEEGMEVKASVSAQARKAHDVNDNYKPKRQVRTTTSLFNYPSDVNDNVPYMYSDGTIKMYGQTLARIKSGSITIANTLTPHKYVGNYDRTITTAHTAGQRTYEIQLNLMITDRTIWDELRKQTETTDTSSNDLLLEIEFSKSDNDKIVFKFNDYITTSVDMPFPNDKGPLEVNLTAQARTLDTCQYTGKWIIQG